MKYFPTNTRRIATYLYSIRQKKAFSRQPHLCTVLSEWTDGLNVVRMRHPWYEVKYREQNKNIPASLQITKNLTLCIIDNFFTSNVNFLCQKVSKVREDILAQRLAFQCHRKGAKKSICAIFLLKSQLCLTKANFVSKNDMKRIPLPNEPIPWCHRST